MKETASSFAHPHKDWTCPKANHVQTVQSKLSFLPSRFYSVVQRKHWVTICAWHLVETIDQKNVPRPFVLNESNLLLAEAKCPLSFCQKRLVYHICLLSSHTIMETLWDILKTTALQAGHTSLFKNNRHEYVLLRHTFIYHRSSLTRQRFSIS